MTCTAALLLAALATAPAPSPGGDGDLGPPRFPSLSAAESLRGGTGAVAWAGFASVGAAYGQGLTLIDDLGVEGRLDWSTTEMTLGAFWRRQLGTTNGWTVGGRLGIGWYLDFGGRLIHDDNRADRGFTLAPALVLSTRAGAGAISIAGDLPLTITTWRGGGFVVAPKVSATYEAPLYGPWTLGITGGLAWRGGGGGAPMRSGRVEPELLVLGGYRVF